MALLLPGYMGPHGTLCHRRRLGCFPPAGIFAGHYAGARRCDDDLVLDDAHLHPRLGRATPSQKGPRTRTFLHNANETSSPLFDCILNVSFGNDIDRMSAGFSLTGHYTLIEGNPVTLNNGSPPAQARRSRVVSEICGSTSSAPYHRKENFSGHSGFFHDFAPVQVRSQTGGS